MTNLWALSLEKENIDLKERIKFDIYYVNNMSLTFDIKIIFKTIAIILGRTGEY
jgi:lipopolysaccharide/colanic/teichoic acid biosynthesis glycosyltransferase